MNSIANAGSAPFVYTGTTDRARWSRLLDQVAEEAFAPAHYVGQESFIAADEAIALAHNAVLGPDSHAVELCCGIGGLTRLIAGTFGCSIVGVDRSRDAIRYAARHTRGPWNRGRTTFLVGDAANPPLAGRFDAVFLLESLHGIRDKWCVLWESRRLLRPGGRLILSLETGAPLSEPERRSMAGGQNIWLEAEPALTRVLQTCGFERRYTRDLTEEHATLAGRLAQSFARRSALVSAEMGQQFLDDAIAAHRLWADWLSVGRVRKLALVAQRVA